MMAEGAKLLAHRGLARIGSLMDVAEAADVPRGSAYYYFRSWHALVSAMVDSHVDLLHERVGEAEDAAADLPPEERLAAVALAFLQTLRENEAEHRVQFQALHALPPPIAEALKRKHRWLAVRIGMVIASAVPELAERPELFMPAAMSFLSLGSYSVLWFRDDGQLRREEYARMLALMVVEGARRMVEVGSASGECDSDRAG